MHLVLLPGMDGTGSLFSRFVSVLGHGLGATVVQYPCDQALGYSELETIARTFLPQDQPFIIVGESFSGPIAISLAASKPSGLAGVVLCCSFVKNPRPILVWSKSLLGLVPFNRLPKAFLYPFLLGRYSSGPLRSEIAEAISGISNDVMRARIKAVFEVDVSEKLQRLAVPVLYLRATKDRVVPRAASEHVHRVAPHVRLVEREAPHLLLQTIPAAAVSVINEFIRAVEGINIRT